MTQTTLAPKTTKEKILADHKNGNADVKKFIESTWPQLFVPQHDYKKIKTFQDACKLLKLDPKKCLPKTPEALKHLEPVITANAKLMIIGEALRGSWKADWKDGDQKKYYPWFYTNSPGFGFSGAHYGCTYSDTAVGSRLVFPTSEIAEYFGKQFIDLHEISITK